MTPPRRRNPSSAADIHLVEGAPKAPIDGVESTGLSMQR
jgi:hypothetical protein